MGSNMTQIQALVSPTISLIIRVGEQKFHAIFALGSESSRGRKFHPWNFRSRERKYVGTRVPVTMCQDRAPGACQTPSLGRSRLELSLMLIVNASKFIHAIPVLKFFTGLQSMNRLNIIFIYVSCVQSSNNVAVLRCPVVFLQTLKNCCFLADPEKLVTLYRYKLAT